MAKLFDPLAAMKVTAASTALVVEAPAVENPTIPYETPLVPPPGAKTIAMVINATDGPGTPILYDPSTRTCYPVPV